MSAEPYIPLSRREVIDRCLALVADHDKPRLRRLAKLLTAWYHHSHHAYLEALKRDYERDPTRFAAALDDMAEAANFSRVTQADLEGALSEESMFRLRLTVDFDDFEEIVFYRRGSNLERAEIPRWHRLTKRSIEFNNLAHVLVYVRFKPAAAFADPDDLPFVPGSSMLKLFENVPEADLEMLFPNTQVRMRLIDKLFIGVPAFVSGFAVLTTKVGSTLLIVGGLFGFWFGLRNEPVVLDQASLAALLTGAGALGAYLWKQYSSFKNRKIRFMKALTENLYFKTLANDVGVLAYLIDRAEESETKEVLLAYTELLTCRCETVGELQNALNHRLGGHVNFDASGAVEKLAELGWLQGGDERLGAVLGIDEAFAMLDERWDKLFQAA